MQRYFPTNALQTADAQTFMRSTTEKHTGERGFLSLVQGLSAQVKHNLEQQKKATNHKYTFILHKKGRITLGRSCETIQ